MPRGPWGGVYRNSARICFPPARRAPRGRARPASVLLGPKASRANDRRAPGSPYPKASHVNDRQPRFHEVSARADFPALDKRVLELWKERRVFEKSLSAAGPEAPLFVFYEGPPDGQRPPRLAPRHLAHLQGPLPALQDDARLPRPPQGRLGHARPAGRARGRALARHRRQEADRGVRRRRVQQALPRERRRLPRGVGGVHRAHRLLGRPRRRLLHLHQRVHRDRLVAPPADLGQGPALPGLQGRPLLPALRHGDLEPRGRAGLQGRHRGLDLPALPADR